MFHFVNTILLKLTKTNVIGTQNLVMASLKNNVKKFLHVSTDKVVDPISCMGATKLLAERIVINGNLIKGSKKNYFFMCKIWKYYWLKRFRLASFFQSN